MEKSPPETMKSVNEVMLAAAMLAVSFPPTHEPSSIKRLGAIKSISRDEREKRKKLKKEATKSKKRNRR